ncbi:minor capsid protein [Catenibacterium sp.]|jgi:SPP1 gp7 family putative phage head morphogenesis protein|uniref:minor capsid protein n=1 Tax=Catenibacterium sp. TaxID=2049022 RepID=UPI0020495C58|nr:MAG TPA: minor capsid protein [Caudoviricetes sp.]
MTNIKNIKYWEMREARNMYKDMQLAEDCAKELSVIYSKAAIYTAKQIEGIFNRFASKHHLTRDEAINLLSEADSRNFEKLLEVYKNKTGAQKREALAELEAPAYKNRMKRLDDIDKSINRLINAVASKERDAIDKTMRKVYESSYHHAVYEAARMSGLDLQTGPIDEGALETILKKKWSGQNYSERVWNNTQKVADALKEEFMIGALTGKTEKEMTDSINEQFLSGRNKARRLVRTESSYIHNEAHFQAYKDYGIEEYRFVATLDLRTSQICRERDGSVYRVNDKKIGVNAPPMHPWCRSTTIMNLDDETMHNLERFARDPVTGERMKVPADETYKEWYQRMVEKHGAEAINTAGKSTKNYSSDKVQYQNYINVLGNKFVPDTLEEFQKIKYGNEKQWNDLKYKFRTVNRYKTDYGKVDAETILELDREALTAKDKYMTTKAGKGNVASMKIGDDIYIASSQISGVFEPNYLNYKGEKSKLILSPDTARLTPHLKSVPYKGHEGEYSRDIDTEYKFFEYIYDKVLKGELKNQEIYILSQKSMCFSCDSVYNELVNKKEVIDANIKINVVSGKNNKSWDYRNYETKALNNIKKKVKK